MSCPACFQGKERTDAEPTGTISKVHGRDTYTAEPPAGKSPKGIVVIIPDAFGWEFKNNRILADEYARQGDFRVYLPDFMDGAAAPLWMIDTLDYVMKDKSLTGILTKPYHIACAMYGFVPFLIRNRIGASMPKVTSFLTAIRTSSSPEATLPIGCAGFCWGGKHVVGLAVPSAVEPSTGLPLSDSFFTAHPSNWVVPGDIQPITRPISIAAAELDFATKIEMIREAEAILKRNGVNYEVVEYKGAGHGWSVRIDRTNEKQKEQAEEAERQAVAWFTKTFAEVKR